MRKGQLTRAAILERAMDVASRCGLGGLTIGTLAEETQLSKSGLFAHFKSKESLQIDVLNYVANEFIERVVRAAMQEPRGIPRIRAIFDGWLRWSKWKSMPGGCIFVAAATELDDRPGPVRDRLVELQRDWLGAIARAASIAVEEKQFDARLDPSQFAHELYGIMLAYHHARRLMHDPKAEARARSAFDALIERAARRRRTA
jgi:AcrR family transcriptional regulator